ncbi:hypothetical protein NEMBOFW57_000352 [Staphylotrichum longicolle]|uniref:SRR1-like domain-containing protein n=1 Tax=Staphylotrichum longicolle TaxID=669026 RepID=A0AAD4EZI3_9PEZI|nr:hypothetical protein NEMBOFW57_000352 [Staphylotrichum longicolle]
MDMLKHVTPMVLQDVPCPPLTPEKLKTEATHACELLQAHYNAGRPFFSKAQLRDLAEQLVRGLDGRAVSFPVEIGKDHGCHPRGPEFRIIATAPALRYCPPAAPPAVFHPSLALLPVEIAFTTKISSSSSFSVVEPAPACSSVSAATVSARLALARQEQRDCVARLCALLKPVLPEGTDKVVAFACGTMGSVGDGGGDGGEEEKGLEEMVGRSTAQHALTLQVRDLLRDCAGRDAGDVRCYAQDPGYTVVDEQVLGKEGVDVVDDPEGFLEVDEASVVISVCPNVPD